MEAEDTDKFPTAPANSGSKHARSKQLGGRSLLVTRTNSSFDEIDGGADNEGGVLAYSTSIVKPESTALEDRKQMASRCKFVL